MKKIILLLLVPIFCFSQNSPSTLIFSEYGEGSSFNKWIEIYNPTNQQINMDEYRYNFCWNGCDSLLWEFSLAYDSGRVLMPGETYLIVAARDCVCFAAIQFVNSSVLLSTLK